MDDPYKCMEAMQREIDSLKKQNEQLRSRLEPERQKIWVLVWRDTLGKPCSIAYDKASEATESARFCKLKPSDYVIIHASL